MVGFFLVGGQPDDLDFEVSEDMEGLDEGGRHLGDDEDDEEEEKENYPCT